MFHRSARIRHAIQFIPLSALSLKRASSGIFIIHSFIHLLVHFRTCLNASLFSIFLLAFVFLISSVERKLTDNGAIKRAWTWKRENEERTPFTRYAKQVYEHHTRFSPFVMLDIAFPFERDTRKMTQQIISLTIVAFFFSSLFFCWSRSGISPVRRWSAILILSTTLKSICSSSSFSFSFASFFLLHGWWYNETGLLVILPATLSVCLGALRTPRSDLLYFNHPPGFLCAFSRGWADAFGLKYLSTDGAVEFYEIASFLVAPVSEYCCISVL